MDTLTSITNSAARAHEWTAARDSLISKAVADGHSLRTVGIAAGMHHTSIRNILRRDIKDV